MKISQQKPCFFKVMIDDFNQKLEIPEAFVKNISEKLPETAVLKRPSGSQWRVKVRRTTDGRLYLEDGWGCFSRALSLSFGEFVLFRYEGRMNFTVEIYSTNTLAREDAFPVTNPKVAPKPQGVKRRGRPPKFEGGYKCQGSKRRGKPPNVKGRYHIGSRSIMEPRDLALFFKNAEITRQNCVSEPRKQHQSVSLCEGEKRHGMQLNLEKLVHDHENRKLESRKLPTNDLADSHNSPGHEAESLGSDMLAVNNAVREEVAAPVFTSDFPHFSIELRAYSIKFPFQLNVPINFARAHFQCREVNIMLRNLSGEIWKVKLYKTRSSHRFIEGWKQFMLDNSLKEGDYCVFELVAKLTMNVHIFRVHAQGTLKKSNES